jgi:signal transduction histidine kinase
MTSRRRSGEPSLDDLAKLNSELVALHREVSKRARDLARINRELEERQRQIEQLEQMRQDLVQQMVHDLRGPLSSIHAAISLALQGALGPLTAPARKVFSRAKESSTRLVEMIASILELANAEDKPLEIRLQRLSVEETIAAVLREHGNHATEAGVTLERSCSEPLEILADRSLAHRILGNYVSNAIKFSPRGGLVTIAASRADDRVRIAVTDRGPGIAIEQQGRLFTKYGRVERRGISTGLGLAICKELAEAMGGRVGVCSAAGEGATFWFELPAPPADGSEP